MKNCASNTLFLFSLVLLLGDFSLVSSDSLQDKCSPEFTKLGECLSYASAKADAPSAACCGSVTEIRQKDAACLCYIIQQAHGGGSTVSSLGLQVDRLIKLPTACKLANTNVSDCPKLLNLPPDSPDYGIFTNATKAGTTPTGPSGPSGSSRGSSSEGTMNRIQFVSILTATMMSARCFTIFQV